MDIIFDAVAEGMPSSLRALSGMEWTEANAHHKIRARQLLRDRVIGGDWAAARVLGRLGTAEDIPALAQGLERALRGEIEMIDSGWRLTETWDPERGPSPLEARQWFFRAAMARLGDPGQLDFFRQKLLHGNRHWVHATLREAYEIARPELAEAIIKWLFDVAPWDEGDGFRGSLGMHAAGALVATFPDLKGEGPRWNPGESKEEYARRLNESWQSWIDARGWETYRTRPMESPPAGHRQVPEEVGDAPRNDAAKAIVPAPAEARPGPTNPPTPPDRTPSREQELSVGVTQILVGTAAVLAAMLLLWAYRHRSRSPRP